MDVSKGRPVSWRWWCRWRTIQGRMWPLLLEVVQRVASEISGESVLIPSSIVQLARCSSCSARPSESLRFPQRIKSAQRLRWAAAGRVREQRRAVCLSSRCVWCWARRARPQSAVFVSLLLWGCRGKWDPLPQGLRAQLSPFLISCCPQNSNVSELCRRKVLPACKTSLQLKFLIWKPGWLKLKVAAHSVGSHTLVSFPESP